MCTGGGNSAALLARLGVADTAVGGAVGGAVAGTAGSQAALLARLGVTDSTGSTPVGSLLPELVFFTVMCNQFGWISF